MPRTDRTIRLTPLRTAVTIVVAAVLLVLAGTGGAVAAHLITSRDIQNKTIRSVDVSPQALEAFEALQRYEVVNASVAVAPGAKESVVASCRPDKRALGVTGFFDNAVPIESGVFLSDGSGGLVDGTNTGPAETELNIRITCASIRLQP